MFVLLAAAAVQPGVAISNSAPAQPVVVSLQQPSVIGIDARPPIVTSSRIAPPQQAADVVVPVRLRVAAGNRLLFNDVLRVARNSGASYQENRSEAGATVCHRPGHYGSGERHSLNVNLSWREDSTIGTAVHIDVNWRRPGEGVDPCLDEGSRSIAVSQTVPLAPGETRTIRGDGGLAVTVSRP